MAIQPEPEVTSAHGQAGTSARREYQKRAERERAKKQAAIDADREWREQVVVGSPIIGRIARVIKTKPQMTPESQATKAWATGADGEERVAEVLAQAGVTALHDRKVPRSKANIDHIAVTKAGVFVIDAKKYTGLVESRDKGTLLRSDVRLYVNNRDRTKLVKGVQWQCDVVRKVLGDDFANVPVKGVLCFVGANWRGLFKHTPVEVDGVTSVWPLGLAGVIERPSEADVDVDGVTTRLASVLKPA